MANQYTTVGERDLGAGIDQQSSENHLQPGYAEDIINMDPQATGAIKTRAGYQGYLGGIPLRVKSIDYNSNSENNLCFYLDGSVDLTTIDLSGIRSSPIIVFGKTSSDNINNTGDFPSDTISANYYSGFTVELRKIFLAGTNTLSIPAGEHPYTNPFLFVGVTRSTSATGSSNSQFYPDSISINKTNYQIDIDYTNSTEFEGFSYILDKSAEAGTNFISGVETVTAGNITSFSYDAATHGLSNFNIIVKAFINNPATLDEVMPESVEIDTTGEVTITVENSTAGDLDYYFILTAAPISNIVTGSIAAGNSSSIVIEDIENNFMFATCYLEQTIDGIVEQVLPDSVEIDAELKTATISFTNNLTVSTNFQVYYIYANIATNKLCVTASQINPGDVFSDDNPQLTIYGQLHSEVYGGTLSDNQGFVNHIDSYRAAGEDRIIAGLGGNLFSATEVGESILTDYNLAPTYYTNLRGRVSSETVVGPVFYDTTDSPDRTRGYIQTSTGGDNWLEVTTIAYQSSTGLVRYTLDAPGIIVTGTLSDIISTADYSEDYLTVKSAGHSRLNGQFKIKEVQVVGESILIDVENSQITDSCFDEEDVGGFGGVFSEQVELVAVSPFLPGDFLNTETVTNLEVYNSSDKIVSFNGITELTTLPAGLRFVGTRTTNIIPLRTLDNIKTTENMVRQDMLIRPDLARKLQIKYVNPYNDESISISGDGYDATVTVSTYTTAGITVGQTILIRSSTNYNGFQVVTDILDDYTFQFSSSVSGTESGTLVGNLIQVDEELEIHDTLDSSESYTVQGRWMPIEAPTTVFNLPPQTHKSYFNSNSYTLQPIIRSTMVQDGMYFVNGDDEVLKYDGENIYRAGLFRWQPHLYSSIDTTSTGKIDTGNFTLLYSSVSDNTFVLTTAADSYKLSVGQQIKDNKSDKLYYITKIEETSGTITVNKNIDTTGAGASSINTVSQYSYYFRLNMVDRNNNVIGSAVTGSEDFVITLGEDSAVNIRLVGMPVWDIYDYDRIEVQIYRTKANDFTNFFLLTTLPLNFDNNSGYLDYNDTDSDSDLINDDSFAVAIAGAELPTAISEPLRAKYITSSDNRLVLANITDYPTFDIQFIQNQTGPITRANFLESGNSRYLFRINNLDVETTTNITERIGYEFTTNSTSITSITNNSGDSFTVTATNSLAAGDWVYLYHSAVVDDLKLKYSGLFMVESATGSDFTIIFPHSSSYSPGVGDVDSFSVASDSRDVPVFLGEDGNYPTLNGNRLSTESYEFIAVRRLANMINSSMRMVNYSLYPEFSPYLIANAGGEYKFGQIVVRCPKVLPTNLELQLPTLSGSFDIAVNNIFRAADSSAGTLTRTFPSRTLISYPNFPEIFDNPTASVDSDSFSAIDINSADGQEITSCIPFFGDSAFGQASKSGIIVNFKENSIYLSDIAAKVAVNQGLVSNTPIIQKLETEGKGCTAPYSVAATRAGIMFANFSGIYRLNKNLSIEYIGRKMERFWREQVNRTNISLITAHHYANGNQYKLSVPVGELQERNNYVLVYSHTREYEGGMGSWTTYDNHHIVGYANLGDDSYLASSDGQVFSVRRANDNTDYRDANQPISWRFLTRAMDFGDSGIRKGFGAVITHYRTISNIDTVLLKSSTDMDMNRDSTDLFTITKPTGSTGLSDSVGKKVISIKSSLSKNIGNYLQLEYTGNVLDKPVEIAGIDIRVTGMDDRGLTEAADT